MTRIHLSHIPKTGSLALRAALAPLADAHAVPELGTGVSAIYRSYRFPPIVISGEARPSWWGDWRGTV